MVKNEENILLTDILHKSEIDPKDSVTEIIENDKGKFEVKYGTIIIDGEKTDELKIISVDYEMPMKLNGELYPNSERLNEKIKSCLSNENYVKAAKIFYDFKQKYQPVLEEICKQIAGKNEGYKLWEQRVKIAPYQIFMSKI